MGKMNGEGFNKHPFRPVPKWLGWLYMAGYLAFVWSVGYHLAGANASVPVMLFWQCLTVVTLYQLGVLLRRKNVAEGPVAAGRVAVIIPVYNEDDDAVHAAIDALLEQTRVPDDIYVVDDGSKVPVKPYVHERVHWFRQENAGKRHAQGRALRAMADNRPDFILTIDSDCITNIYACETLLRALSNPRIEAVTGMTYVLNMRKNLLTRIVDVNLGTACLTTFGTHNGLGALETAHGPLAMYRARVLFDNYDDYLTSGTYGDDRRLNIYALLYGDTVGVQEATTFTSVPETLKELWKQRRRWSQSPWLQLPFMVVNLSWRKIIYPLFTVVQWLVMLLLYAQCILTIVVMRSFNFTLILLGFFTMLRYVQSGLYLYSRPDMGIWEKTWTFLFITPLETLLRFFMLTPLKTIALFQLRDKGWGTRQK